MQSLKNFIEKSGIQTTSEITPDMIMVVTRVTDFDPESNEVWEIQGNRSYPRERVVCDKCKNPVVMSDFAFSQYQKNQNPEKVICGQCAFKL